ncbi:putative TolA family protein [Balamuthia mandrillaris]
MQGASSDLERFKEVIARRYKDQAIFFLNAFWAECRNDAEKVWQSVEKFQELDLERKKEGNDLDEFNAHRFLEFWGETQTVVKMRDMLRELGLNRHKRMSLIEYLVCKYGQTVHELLSRPQGTNEELVRAQEALEAVQTEINKIETRKAELERLAQGSGVKAMQAKNELSQLLTQDNTALNRALLTAEAAVRKAQKAGGEAQGALWWLERELEEAKKYKPRGNLRT